MSGELDRLNFDPRTQPQPSYSGLGGGDTTDYDAIQTQAQADVQQLQNRVAPDLQIAQDLPNVQAMILVTFRDALGALASDNDHSYQWLLARTQDTRSQAMQALDEAEAAAAQALGRVRADVLKAIGAPPTGNAQDAMLQELQLKNAWDAARMILEAPALLDDPYKALQLATEQAGSDPIARAAIRRFGPSWVTATYSDHPQYVRDRILTALHAGLDAAELPAMSVLQKAGRAILADCDRGTKRLRVNSHECRSEIEGKSTASVLAAWQDGQTIPFTYRGPAGTAFAPSGAITPALGKAAYEWAQTAKQRYPYLFIGENSNSGSRAGSIVRGLFGQAGRQAE
jgi:hypothetical protein